MHDRISVWFVGCLAVAATITSEVLNAALAFSTSSYADLLLGLRIFLFVAFGFSLVGIASLIYFTVLYVPSVSMQKLGLRHTIWIMFGVGVGVAVATLIVPGVALVWLVLQRHRLPTTILGSSTMAWIAAWFSGWGASVLLQIALFAILGAWTRQELKIQSVGRLDLDFGIRLPQMDEVGVNGSRRSLASRDTTLASPPQTPSSSQAPSSLRYSSSTKGTAATSRTKLVTKSTPRSSTDAPEIPNMEPLIVDTNLEFWDSPTTYRDSRSAPGSSPLMARPGLEPIPGSRSASAASIEVRGGLNILLSSPPQAISADTATALDWSASPTALQTPASATLQHARTPSTATSSPPNFSRPTSKQHDKSSSFSTSPLQDLIHPLFRMSSPHPPPIATTGSMVTASPIANNPITPKTLAKLRTNLFSDRARSKSPPPLPSKAARPTLDTTVASAQSTPARKSPRLGTDSVETRRLSQKRKSGAVAANRTSSGHWRAMPSVDQSQSATRPSTAGSTMLGSPGPSIVDDDELPPIIPGFVLGAGSRTSMLGYKERNLKKEHGVQAENGQDKGRLSLSLQTD